MDSKSYVIGLLVAQHTSKKYKIGDVLQDDNVDRFTHTEIWKNHGSEYSGVYSIAVGDNGNVYVYVIYEGLIAYDKNGTELWRKSNSYYSGCVVSMNDKVYCDFTQYMGGVDNDYNPYIVCFDANGTEIYKIIRPGIWGSGKIFCADLKDNLYVADNYYNTEGISKKISKYNSIGELILQIPYDLTNKWRDYILKCDKDCNLYLSMGDYYGSDLIEDPSIFKFDENGTPIWSIVGWRERRDNWTKWYDVANIEIDNDGNVYAQNEHLIKYHKNSYPLFEYVNPDIPLPDTQEYRYNCGSLGCLDINGNLCITSNAPKEYQPVTILDKNLKKIETISNYSWANVIAVNKENQIYVGHMCQTYEANLELLVKYSENGYKIIS